MKPTRCASEDDWARRFRTKVSMRAVGRYAAALRRTAALWQMPKIFLMDEAFDALNTFDAVTREHMNEGFQQIYLETRKTELLITYSFPEAVFQADWVSRQNGPDRSRRSTTRPLLNRGGSAAIQFV